MHLGDRRRREAAADGLVEDEVYDAALVVERVVVEAPPPPHPTAPGAVVEEALRRVPALVASALPPRRLASRAIVNSAADWPTIRRKDSCACTAETVAPAVRL